MEITQEKFGSTSVARILRVCIFSFLFLFAAINPAIAQENNSLTDSSAAVAAESSEGPSLENLSKSLAASSEEINKIKEKQRRDEILSYIYMGVGFSIVIGIAWFTTALARKRKKKDDEQKAIRMHHMKHKPHHPRR